MTLSFQPIDIWNDIRREIILFHGLCIGKPQKSSFYNGRAIKRGEGVKGRSIRTKQLFKTILFFKIRSADGHEARGGGG